MSCCPVASAWYIIVLSFMVCAMGRPLPGSCCSQVYVFVSPLHPRCLRVTGLLLPTCTLRLCGWYI